MLQHVDVVMAEPSTADAVTAEPAAQTSEPDVGTVTQDEAPRRARKPRSAGEGETHDR